MPPDRTPRLRALVHAMNFKETLREVWAGSVYMARKARGRETDHQARREAALEDVFGRTRFDIKGGLKEKVAKEKVETSAPGTMRDLAVTVDVEETVHVGSERQWLGTGDDYGYGLGYHSRREKSDGLEAQFERELAARGYPRRRKAFPLLTYDEYSYL